MGSKLPNLRALTLFASFCYYIAFCMRNGIRHSLCNSDETAQRVRFLAVVLAALLLFVQVFVEAHHHADFDHADEEGVPSAECSLCVVAAHFVADIPPKPAVQSPLYSVSERIAGPSSTGIATAIALSSRPRAPPAGIS